MFFCFILIFNHFKTQLVFFILSASKNSTGISKTTKSDLVYLFKMTTIFIKKLLTYACIHGIIIIVNQRDKNISEKELIMKILVNGEIKDITVIGKNNIEWTEDFINSANSTLEFNEEKEIYTMQEEDFKWWANVADIQNQITKLEDELDSDQLEKYQKENFQFCDLETELESRLDWLKEETK